MIVTGGLASTIAKVTDTVDCVDNMLTLDGLKILYDLNEAAND